MTELEWLACEKPDDLLDSPHCDDNRKRRLFACACARGVLHYLKDSQFEEGLRVAEAFADGMIERDQLLAFRASSLEARDRFAEQENLERERSAASAVLWACEPRGPHHRRAANQAQFAVAGGTYASKMAVEAIRQAGIIRDIFGNPFRPITLNPSWLTSTVVSLAQLMYDSRDFSAMPILADALQDAGCENEDILNHSRDPKGVHVRGCFVVDRILGKK